METRKTPLALTASALALALMLAGCGGGSSSSTEPTAPAAAAPPPAPPAPPPAPEPEPVTLTLPESDYVMPAPLEDMEPFAVTADSTDVGAYTLTCTSTEPCMVEVKSGVITVTSGEVDEDVMFNAAYMQMIEDAKKTVMVSFKDAADVSYLEVADVTEAVEIAASETEYVGPYKVMNNGSETAMVTIVGGKVMVTGVAVTDVEVTGFTPTAMAEIKAEKTAKMDTANAPMTRALGVAEALKEAGVNSGAPMPSISRAAGKATAFKLTGFKPASATRLSPSLDRIWARQGFTRDTDTVTEQHNDFVAIYSDIDADKLTDFDKVFPDNGTFTGITTTDGKTINIGSTLTKDDANLWLDMSGTHFPVAAGKNVTWTYGDVKDPNTSHKEERLFDGTFQGAYGEYECVGTCSVTANLDGSYAFAGTWTFEADNGAKAHVKDADHLHFGYWIKTPDDWTGEPGSRNFEYMVSSIAGGVMPYEHTGLANLPASTTAKYAGAAVGLYTTQTVDNSDEVTAAAWGEFTAMAELTAKFPASGTDTLEGMVSDFKGGSGMEKWLIELQSGNLTASAGGGAEVTGGPVLARLDDDTRSINDGSSWRAALYGPHQDSNNNPIVPSGVTGHFNVLFEDDTRIVGAFGAR